MAVEPSTPSGPKLRKAAPQDASAARSLRDALAPFEEGLRQHLPSPDDILKEASERRRAAGRKKRVAAALALAGLCIGIVWLDPAYRSETLETRVGERLGWSAPDGSRITLNTDTRVEVSMHLRSRRVSLLKGEAVFEVAHAPLRLERSFVVHAHRTTVHDIGTIFGVRNHADGADVNVIQGRVRVEAEDGGSREVDAGLSVFTREGSLVPGGQALKPVAVEWRHGRLVLDGTTLRQAVEEIQRYRRSPIVLAEGPLGDMRVSGQFDLDRLDQLVDLLPSLMPVRVRREADGAVHIEPRSP